METVAKTNTKNKFGQYFTPEIVVDFMIELANISSDSKILEPSCGKGIFLKQLQKKGFHDLTAYEIDKDLAQAFTGVHYESFVSAAITERFDLVIGNPPYIRWKNLEPELKEELAADPLWNKYFNSLCDYLYIFILKSIELLNENGQLIFICPEYWMNTTHSLSLRNYMASHGHFEAIYHFNETPIFDNATVSIVIFKFIKGKSTNSKIKITRFYANQKLTSETLQKLKNAAPLKDAEYLQVSQFKENERWLLQTDAVKKELSILENSCRKENSITYHTIGEFCDIGNGMVSGLDKAFRVNGTPLNEREKDAIIKVVKAKDLKPFFAENVTQYIYINEALNEAQLVKDYPNLFAHFQPYKEDLGKRYQYNRIINYWEWVFLRNLALFKKTEKRIFVPCKERISNKAHFRFALVDEDIFPTQDVTAIFKKATTKESIGYILAYLNQPVIFDWLKCNGIVKGNIVEFSEKPVASIPFKAIDWSNATEVELHDAITEKTKRFIENREEIYLKEIHLLFDRLLSIV